MGNGSTAAARLSPIPPPRNRRRFIEVLRAPKGGAHISGVCLNQDLHACLMHWDDAQNAKLRCTGTKDCPFCPYLHEARWYAYMPVFRKVPGKVACLEVTLEAARLCPQTSDKRVPLRGKLMTIFRVGQGKFGQGRCTVEDEQKLPLPPAEDMDEFMLLVCGKDEECFCPDLHKKRLKEEEV